MSVENVWYTTLEDVKQAPDWKTTADNEEQLRRHIEAASRAVEGILQRVFYPIREVRFKDWPDDQFAPPWTLYLNQDELIELFGLKSGGIDIPLENVVKYPNSGPPFNRLELKLDSSSAFGGGSTHQQDMEIDALFGYRGDEIHGGRITESLSDEATSVTVNFGHRIKIGHIIRIDDERMIVDDKELIDSGFVTEEALSNKMSDEALTTTVDADFRIGEFVVVGRETMRIRDVLSPALYIVRRGVDGSTIANHDAGEKILTRRRLSLRRGELGTNAASHSDNAPVSIHHVPSLVQTLTMGFSIHGVPEEHHTYPRMAAAQVVEGWSLGILQERTLARYGRSIRKRAV